jgi:hypothetical protein
MIKRPRQHDEKHLAFLRQLPCVVCGNNIETEAAHIRMADNRAAKRPAGMQEKSDDCWAVPLCGQHHRQQHETSERKFWERAGIDPIFTALALWRVSGDHEAGDQIVRSR